MQNITSRQEALLDQLRKIDPALTFEWDEVRGVASFVRGKLVVGTGSQSKPETIVQTFLATYGELFGALDISKMLEILRTSRDDLGWTHLEYQQLHRTTGELQSQQEVLEVYGSKLVAHVLPDSTLKEVQSSCWREIQLEDDTRLTPKQLKDTLTKAVVRAPGFSQLRRLMKEQKEEDFPIMQKPRLVIYPWQGGFRIAWTTYAYGTFDVDDRTAQPTGAKMLDLGQVFVDAATGEVILFARTSMGLETPDTGTGLGVTPFGGPFVTRDLNIVRVDTSSTYRLRDTTHPRDITTYDAANSSSFSNDDQRGVGLNAGTLAVSADTDGDKSWNTLPTDSSVAQRTASQQPQTDIHFFIRDIYEWYDALAGGRAGWDDGQYPNPPVPDQTVRIIAHARDGVNPSSINAGMRRRQYGGNFLYWLQFFDGDRTTYDYLAGSKFIVGHEYQHAITDFSFKDAAGNPGLTYADWLAAVHEGLSDVFGGLYSEQWLPGTDISPVGQIFRNIAYPRDPGPPPATAAYDSGKFDHFADRDVITGDFARYFRGDILAHCAYLMGAGGVHRRDSRTPALIPVYTLGRQTISGRDVLKAARIWYRALRFYFGTVGSATGVPTNDQNTFRNIRNACVSAAEDIYGAGSPEHANTILAWYAVGLHPTATSYGPDVTCLRWKADWWMSSAYIGMSSPDWASLDLYVKNGTGASGWNALSNVIGADGNPTEFENDVYCRVRNVGDQQADNVMVTFEYAKAGSAPFVWVPVLDNDGVPQTLNLGSLAAGLSNFPDSDQDSPPTTARVKWAIPPIPPGETVDHYCLLATVTSSNDVNPHNNQVQSNIAYAPYAPGSGFSMAFKVGNPRKKAIPLELRVQASLPRGWEVSVPGAEQIKRLKRGEERTLEVRINMKEGADRQLEPPLDGDVQGNLFGSISAPVTGTLTATVYDGSRLGGRFAGSVEELGALVGGFEGKIDTKTGEIKGRVIGIFQCGGSGKSDRACVGVKGCLRPWRRVDISQWLEGAPLGGITVQVQVPLNSGPCGVKLPPTDTRVAAPKQTKAKAAQGAKAAQRSGSNKPNKRKPR